MKIKAKHENAFTVMEVLMVVFIISLLAGIIVVSVGGVREKARIAAGLQFNATVKNFIGADIFGEWNFNEGSGSIAADSSNYHNDATIYGATWVDSVPQLGKALNFSGGQYVRTDNTSSFLNLTGKSVTVTAWVKFSSIQSGYRCIYNYHPSTGWYTLYKSDSHTLHMRIGNAYLNGSEVFVAGRWYFLVGTWNNDTKKMTLYVNGKQDKIADKSPTWTTSDDSYGYVGGSPGENLDAIIDEVKVYGSTLTQAEIEGLYLAGLEQLEHFAKK